jgi:phage tail-like protein
MRSRDAEKLLPAVYRRAAGERTPLRAVLDLMEALHAPVEQCLAGLEERFDPRRAPDAFVPYLAGWVDLEWLFTEPPASGRPPAVSDTPLATGLGRLRELVAVASRLSQWRGTARGLLLFLETATGLSGFRIEETPLDPDGRPQPFHLRVHCPEEATTLRPLVQRIVEFEKPAYVTYELDFEQRAEPAPARGRRTR